MILRRLGNKKKLMPKLIKRFPAHKIWIEPFFGSGSAFFYKPKAKYNIVNDLDSDVYNLFQVVMNQKKELEKAFYIMPIHSDLLEYWKQNKETDPVKKALRFLFLSNIPNPVNGGIKQRMQVNDKKIFFENIDKTYEAINDIVFINNDFRKFFEYLYWNERRPNELKTSFIYADPPYLNTTDNYSHRFTKQDSIDLFDCLEKTGCKFAMSEFNNPFIIEQANKRKLNIITIGKRQNLKNRRTEILITNYKNLTLF